MVENIVINDLDELLAYVEEHPMTVVYVDNDCISAWDPELTDEYLSMDIHPNDMMQQLLSKLNLNWEHV